MPKRFDAGARVQLNPASRYINQAPPPMLGTVVWRQRAGMDYSVMWDDGTSNAYNDSDLDPAGERPDINRGTP